MVYSIIRQSQLEGAHRLDAEYFAVDQMFKDYYLGSEIINFVQYGTSDELNEEKIGYPTLRLNEFEDYFIKEPTKYCASLSEKEFHSLKLKKDDLLICRTNGNPLLVGKSAIVIEDKPYAFASYLFRLRTDTRKINSASLLAYLHSSYGRAEIEKNQMISNQTNFSPARFKLIRIPKFDAGLQEEIHLMVKNCYGLYEQSKDHYQQAENLLLAELGLKDFQPKDELTFVVNLSDVQSAHRADAEFFHPKYQRLIKQISRHNGITLEDVVIMKKGFEPGSEAYQEEGKLFIRVSSLSKNGVEEKDQKYLNEELYKKLKTDYEPKVGEILLTKDATPGIAYVLKEPVEGIISGGILRLKTKVTIDAEYLALCINSSVGKMQAERDAGGSVISHWKPEQIQHVVIPILPKSMQGKIADLVRHSHAARKKSKELLEEAKRRVEKMIEKGTS